MFKVCIKKRVPQLILAVVLCFALLDVTAFANFIPTNRDTGLPPGRAVFEDIPLDEYAFLGQFGDLRYYFRGDRDILMVTDVHGRFTWRTGLDAPFGMDAEDAVARAETEEELRRVAEPIEQRLNAVWVAKANSILTIEVFDAAFNISRISSAGQDSHRVTSNLVEVGHGHFRLDVQFRIPNIFIPVHIHLSDVGITYNIYHEEITGPDTNILAAIIITPFMGAVGGVRRHFDFEAGAYGDPVPEPMIPGYIFVPDGSGALMRFISNTVSLSEYRGTVFGNNPAEAMFFYDFEVATVDRPHPLMPVFGVTHGHQQQSFVAWADRGAEHMEIIMMPEYNTTHYNFVYPRFVMNTQIHQVYNRSGDGFFRLLSEDMRRFDISMQYRFLYGEDASYVGMARLYREHLIQEGVLTPASSQGEYMPVRLDFIMSDVRRSILGRTNVVTTTIGQVEDIVTDLTESGVSSINGGLMGFQRGGITTGRPWAVNFDRNIGSRRDFRNFFQAMDEIGADISLMQDYLHINSFQMNLSRNQAFHANRWGLIAVDSFEAFLPVEFISFARPARSAEWFERQTNTAVNLGARSATATGITNNMISHWGRRDATDTLESIAIFQEAFANSPVPVNMQTPNQYLWQYTHRFLQSPVFNTQFMITSDTVPFLQLVLHNTMEVYAPWANFSFHTQQDILRMIDYNVFPSFVLTYSPAHYLANTNSLNFFSTEFSIYRDSIIAMYSQMSPILSQVRNLEWTNREVLENGVILNTYSGGVEVLINYTSAPFIHRGVTVPPATARLFS